MSEQKQNMKVGVGIQRQATQENPVHDLNPIVVTFQICLEYFTNDHHNRKYPCLNIFFPSRDLYSTSINQKNSEERESATPTDQEV